LLQYRCEGGIAGLALEDFFSRQLLLAQQGDRIISLVNSRQRALWNSLVIVSKPSIASRSMLHYRPWESQGLPWNRRYRWPSITISVFTSYQDRTYQPQQGTSKDEECEPEIHKSLLKSTV
jgi:hypothetical protein